MHAVLIGLAVVQLVYLLNRQQSLVPLLAMTIVSSSSPVRNPRRHAGHLRIIAYAVLFVWISSLFSLPLFRSQVDRVFLEGDLSLFWYVILAPPKFSQRSFIGTAAFSVFIAITGVFLICRVGRALQPEERKSLDSGDPLESGVFLRGEEP